MGGPVVPLVSIRTATAGPGSTGRRWRVGAARPVSNSPEIDTDLVPEARGDKRCQVIGFADDQGQSQPGDIGPGAIVAACRVDHDDSSARQQHPEERRDVTWPVAQQHPYLLLPRRQLRDTPCRIADLAPGRPPAVVLDGLRAGRQPQHVGDALTQRMIAHHRILGSLVAFSSELRCAASSALPMGLPSRV